MGHSSILSAAARLGAISTTTCITRMTTYVKSGAPQDQGFIDNNYQRRSYEGEDMDGSLRRRINCLTGLVVCVTIVAAASLALSVMLLMQDQDDLSKTEDLALRLSSIEDMMQHGHDDHQKHRMKTADVISQPEVGGSSDQHNHHHSHNNPHHKHKSHNAPPPDDDDSTE